MAKASRRFNTIPPSMVAVLLALQVLIAAAANDQPTQGPRRVLMKQELTFGLILEEVEHAPTQDHPDGYSEERWVAQLPQTAKDLLHSHNMEYMELIDMYHRLSNVANIESVAVDGSKVAKLTSGLSTFTASETIADLDTGLLFVPASARISVDSHSVDTDAQSRSLLRSNDNNNGHHEFRRKLAPTSGELKTIVMRVIDKNGIAPTASRQELKGHVFTNDVCMKSQYDDCSHGKLTIKPSGPGPVTGVFDLKLPNFAIAADGSTSRTAIQNEAVAEARKQIANLDNDYDLTLFCMPPGTAGGWLAYAFVNHQFSFYNDEWCTFTSAQVHEVGHNLGLAHSGEGTADYGDSSGMMGYSFSEVDTLMCFNAAKNFQLQWYTDKVKSISPLSKSDSTGLGADGVKQFVLNGVDDYKKHNDLIVLQLQQNNVIEQDYYIGYNKDTGMNADTKESQDEITVILKESGDPYEFGQSWKVASLKLGGTHTITNFDGKASKNVWIKFVKALNGRATIEIRDLSKAPLDEKDNDTSGVPYVVKLFTDNYPDDQSWQIIQRRDGLHLHTSPVYTKAQSLTETIVYLPYAQDGNDANDCHDFIISDVYGDGICCGQGRGYYTVSRILENGDEIEVIAGGYGVDSDNFTEKSHPICVGPNPNGGGGGATPPTDLPLCEDTTKKVKFINKDGKTKKWNCKKIGKKKKCTLLDLKGKPYWESCPIKCKGKYNASELTKCQLP